MTMTKTRDDYTLINMFTPKQGQADRFLDLQLAETAKLAKAATGMGWRENELFRTADGQRFIIVTRFASAEAQAAWAKTKDFADHRALLAPLLDKVESIPVASLGRHLTRSAIPQQRSDLRLAVITGSTRAGRFAEKPADWIAGKAASFGGFQVTPIDLRDHPMPFLGDPAASKAQTAAAEAFAALVAGFDAYIFTVAEYNHAPTAVLKNALDHGDWARKPAGLVGYGGVGGARAVEHVRAIAAELQMVTMQAAVHIPFGDYLAILKGEIELWQLDHLSSSAEKMLDQLHWWARALRTARTDDLAVAA